MTTLTDQLHGLAEDAPVGLGPDGDDDLWSRGKRLQRRRRVVSASFVVALVIGLGAVTSLALDATQRPDLPPADATTALRLPDRIYDPGPWAPSVAETGPIGPLVALIDTERRTFWGESSTGIAGVSSTGDYAFLPLTGSSQLASDGEGDPRLSPDGRYVAYAVTGETRDEPNDLFGDPVVGIAVYDTVSGETSQQLVPTDHGLDVDGLGWIGDRVLMKYTQYDTFTRSENGSSTSSIDPAAVTWDLRTGVVDTSASRSDVPSFYDATAAAGALVVPRSQKRYVVRAEDGGVVFRGELDKRVEGHFIVSPDGRRVAGRLDPDGAGAFMNKPSSIVVADTTGPRAGVTQEVADGRSEPLAWRGNDHLVVASSGVDGVDGDYAGLVSVDITTGQREPLLSVEQGVWGMPQVASDAWSAPTFAAPEPDRRGDPRRVLWWGGGLVVLLAGMAFWRHRARL